MSKLIYLASPYSHQNKTIMYKRFIDVCNVAGKLTNLGYYIMSPISMNHPWKEHCDIEIGYTWEFWQKFDTELINNCYAVWVCTMDGWKESTGVQAEIKIAKKSGKEIKYVNPETLEITDEPN